MNSLAPVKAVASFIDLDSDDIPWEALPDPDRFYMICKPVGLKKKVGSIILTDSTVDNQQWTHGMVRILKAGPAVYVGKRYADMGLLPEDAPKVGDIVYIQPRQPMRFKVDGELYLMVQDDAVIGRVPKEHAHRIAFDI